MEYTKEQIEEWKEKAKKWDKLEEEVSKFYPDYDDENNELDPEYDGDLGDIGEITAKHFGWL